MRVALAREMIESFGRGDELESFLARNGTGFITMSEALLAGVGEPLPELDAVLLAYHSPDLYYSDVAGCYLSQRLPGSPIPCSVSAPGPGAVFTALRIADGMCRLGELDRGALFAYDQNAVLWDANDAARDKPDSAVLLTLGADGEVAVGELDEIRVDGPGGPVRALADVLDRHRGIRVVAGAGLAAELEGTPYADRVESVPELWCTSAWAGLAALWPLTEPVLVADYQPVGTSFHSCVLSPGETP